MDNKEFNNPEEQIQEVITQKCNDKFWDDNSDKDWDLLVEQAQKDFVQKYNEDGVPILPASWDDHDDDVWEELLMEEYLDEEVHGFEHDASGALIPKRDENGVAILPASWNDDDDEAWEGYC